MVTNVSDRQRSAEALLAAWRDFPVDAPVRPVILTGERSYFHGGGGFRSADAKLAFGRGHISFAPAVPFEVEALLLRAIDPRTDPPGGQGDRPADPVTVTSARKCASPFLTDRGQRELDAWNLRLDAATSALIVLADEAVSARWSPMRRAVVYPRSPMVAAAAVADDDIGLTLVTMGPHASAGVTLSAEVFESRTAVAIFVDESESRRPHGPVPGSNHPYEIGKRLSTELDARVAIGSSGQPITVYPLTAGGWRHLLSAHFAP